MIALDPTMNALGCWMPETDGQRTQRYIAEQIAAANAMQNAWPNVYTPSAAPRFRSIDPTQKLSDKAARLLSLNHFLSAA